MNATLPSPIRFFQSSEKMIYSKGLKLSVAVPHSLRKFWHVNCLSIIFDIAMATTKFHVGLTKNQLFWHNSAVFSSFLHEIAEIHEFVHFVSILAWICLNFLYFLTFFEKKWNPRWQSKMMGQMMSLPTKMVSSCRANSGLSNECYLFHSALTEWKPRGGILSTPPSPLYHAGGMS